MTPQLVLLGVLVPVVLVSAVSDLRQLKIRNTHVLVALALFALVAPFLLDWPELSDRLLLAAATFAVGFVLFALGVIGGGDAKMLPVVMLFIPSGETILFLRIFAIALGVVSIGALVVQRTPALRRLGWSSIDTPRHVPVGVAIAAAVIILFLVLAFRG